MNLDALVISAHPDDAELSMGGTIAKLASLNYKVGLVDLTKGELGTRGNADLRQREAFQAAILLKAALRDNLLMADGDIQINKENLLKVIMVIRKYRPGVIFAPYFNDRHPDHIAVSKLCKKAVFYSGLAKIKTFDKEQAQEPFRPAKLYYFMQTYTFEPSFIFDISETFDTKMKSIEVYSSQFHNPKSKEPETFISKPGFIEFIKARASFYGFKIGKQYGEPFYCEESIQLNAKDLLNIE